MKQLTAREYIKAVVQHSGKYAYLCSYAKLDKVWFYSNVCTVVMKLLQTVGSFSIAQRLETGETASKKQGVKTTSCQQFMVTRLKEVTALNQKIVCHVT